MWKYPSDIRVSENCIDPKSQMVRKTGPRQLFLYHVAGLVRKGISEIALNNRICNLCTDNVIEDEMHFLLCCVFYSDVRISKGAKIRNRYNQVPHLTQDTNGKVTNSQQTPQTRAKRSALSQQVTTKHI